MIKHAQTSCLSVFDNFVGLVLKELTIIKLQRLLMTFWPDLTIVTIFPQNLILLFQLYVNGWTFIQYHGDLICNMVTDYIKESETLDMFKSKIRKMELDRLPITCCLCKKLYIRSRFHKSDWILYCCLWSTITHKVFGTNSSFHAK